MSLIRPIFAPLCLVTVSTLHLLGSGPRLPASTHVSKDGTATARLPAARETLRPGAPRGAHPAGAKGTCVLAQAAAYPAARHRLRAARRADAGPRHRCLAAVRRDAAPAGRAGGIDAHIASPASRSASAVRRQHHRPLRKKSLAGPRSSSGLVVRALKSHQLNQGGNL